MGCDIHCYIDWDDPEMSRPQCWANDIDFDRNYALFGLMAGVRREDEMLFEPRRLPEKRSWKVEYAFSLLVMEDRCDGDEGCSSEEAEDYIRYNDSFWMDENHYRVSHPDWHTPSWLTASELEKVQARYDEIEPEWPNRTLAPIIAAMKVLNDGDDSRSRLVFWFDN